MILVALGVFGWGGANFYLCTGAGKRAVAARLERIVGSPVEIGKAGVAPWGTVSVGEISIGGRAGGTTSSRLEIEAVTARLALFPLLKGQLRVVGIASEGIRLQVVDQPVTPLLAVQEPVPDSTERQEPGSPVVPAPLPTPLPESGEQPPRVAPAATARRGPLERFRIDDAEIVFYAEDGVTERLRVEGLAGEGQRDDAGVMQGTLKFETARVPLGLAVRDGSAKLSVDGGAVKVSDARADGDGGSLHGGFLLQAGAPGGPFRLALSTDGIDAVRFLESFSELPARLTAGKLTGGLVAEGWLQAPGQTRGRLGLRLEKGRLAMASDEEPVERAEVVASFAGGQGMLESAVFQAGPLLVKSTGYSSRAGALRLSLRVYLGRGRGEGPAIAASGLRPFTRWAGTDWFYQDFAVAGTAGQPMIGPIGDQAMVPAGEFLRVVSSGMDNGEAKAQDALRPVSERITLAPASRAP